MSSFPVIVPGGNVSQSTALSTPSVSPDASGGLNQPYQLGLSSEPSFSLPEPVSTGSFFDPSSGLSSLPTFSVTSTASAGDDDTGSNLLSSLPDPLLGLTQASLPSGATSGSTGCAWYDFSCEVNASGLGAQQDTSNITAGAPGTLSTPVTQLPSVSSFLGSTLAGFSWGRIGSFLLALILIAAGLYLFGSQSKTIQGVTRAVLA